MTTTYPPAAKPELRGDAEAPSQSEGTVAAPRPWLRRISILLLLAITALLYLWALGDSGYANSFYSAAAQAGSESWKAFFFGSLDAGNSITVDKPPAALWLMGLSIRIFGLSSWSILVPEALLGVATVGVVYAGIRRISGHSAAVVAGAVTALTPSAALMFRFNNPDALLLFLLVLAGYCVLRAIEKHGFRWLVLAGSLVGLGFLTKMLQAFLVLPAFGLVYLIAAAVPLRKRVMHLLAAVGTMIISLGWWVTIVELWPKASRPYIDGSTKNSVLELIFGYNGFGRLTGNETGQVGGQDMSGPGGLRELPQGYFPGASPGGGGGFNGDRGILRLFQGVSGGMISWLIPAALVVMITALVLIGRAPHTDKSRAALILFGGPMIITGLVFSFMAGIYHDYYTVALAPWIAGTLIIGGAVLWRRRHQLVARIALAVGTAGSTAWAFVLLGQSGQQPYDSLRWVVLGTGVIATAGFVLLTRLPKAAAWTVLGLAGVAAMTGPVAYTIDTVATPHSGSIVTAGPIDSKGGSGARNVTIGPYGSIQQPGPGGKGGPGNSVPGNGEPGRQGMPAGKGGLIDGVTVRPELKKTLLADAGSYTWVAATAGAQNAASYQLATEQPVMAIGGFNGTANSPTLKQFQRDVAEGRIHYYIDGGDRTMGSQGTQDSASQIQSWVQRNFTAKSIDGTTLYDLTEGK